MPVSAIIDDKRRTTIGFKGEGLNFASRHGSPRQYGKPLRTSFVRRDGCSMPATEGDSFPIAALSSFQLKTECGDSRSVKARVINFDAHLLVEILSKGGKASAFRLWLRGKSITPRGFRAMDSTRVGEKYAETNHIPVESFVVRADRLARRGGTSAALDLLYDSADQMMRAGQFDRLDAVLGALPVSQLSVDVLLGVLTATLPAKNRLPARKNLFDMIHLSLVERGEYLDELLIGLN